MAEAAVTTIFESLFFAPTWVLTLLGGMRARIKGGMEPRFYDIWVTRDTNGELLDTSFPNFRQERDRLLALHGAPVPVQCCWNGAVAMATGAFFRGVRFRSAYVDDGECDASECTLLCDDMRNLGYDDVVVDPTVWLAYDASTHARLALRGDASVGAVGGMFRRAGMAVQRQARWDNLDGKDTPQHGSRCCPLYPGSDDADFGHCYNYEFDEHNYTGRYINPRSPRE